MPKKLAEGDLVQISEREPLPADVKSQLFFAHYRGVHGTLSKLYQDGTALVLVEPGSLPDDVRIRHDQGTTAMRQKWLDGLSDEARNRLSAAEKKFALRYSILVAQEDLHAETAAAKTSLSAKAATEPAKPSGEPDLDLDVSPAPRKRLEDLEAEEARHLEEIRQQKAP